MTWIALVYEQSVLAPRMLQESTPDVDFCSDQRKLAAEIRSIKSSFLPGSFVIRFSPEPFFFDKVGAPN